MGYGSLPQGGELDQQQLQRPCHAMPCRNQYPSGAGTYLLHYTISGDQKQTGLQASRALYLLFFFIHQIADYCMIDREIMSPFQSHILCTSVSYAFYIFQVSPSKPSPRQTRSIDRLPPRQDPLRLQLIQALEPKQTRGGPERAVSTCRHKKGLSLGYSTTQM
ncbi:hypothetical protein VTN02DRAFT_4211 [Thermoascus thermophilus]